MLRWLGLLPSAVLLQQVSIGDSDQAWSSLKGCFIFIFYGICKLLLQVSEAVIIIRVYSSNGMFKGSKCLCQEALPLCFSSQSGCRCEQKETLTGLRISEALATSLKPMPVLFTMSWCWPVYWNIGISRILFLYNNIMQNIHETLEKEESCYQRFRQMQRELALIVRKQLFLFDFEVTLKLRNAAEKTPSERSLWD